jgi:hypothetical protein
MKVGIIFKGTLIFEKMDNAVKAIAGVKEFPALANTENVATATREGLALTNMEVKDFSNTYCCKRKQVTYVYNTGSRRILLYRGRQAHFLELNLSS